MTRDELLAFRALAVETVVHCDVLLEEHAWSGPALNSIVPLSQHVLDMAQALAIKRDTPG